MKKCCWLLLLVLVCAVFIGCGSAESTQLPASVKAEMDAAWLKKEGKNLPWDGESGYYGTYDGAVVYIEEGQLTAITEKVVADQKFVWPSSFTINVYKDGVFYDLEGAYAQGILTQKNIERIAKLHDEYLSEKTNWGDQRP